MNFELIELNNEFFKAFVQFAQWFQPEKWVNYRKIFEFLDEIAEKCRKNLKEKFPQLPLLEFPPNFVGISPNSGEILHAASIWSPEDSGNIIRVLCHVFSVEFEFRGDTESYYELRNLLIDQVKPKTSRFKVPSPKAELISQIMTTVLSPG